MSCFFVLTAVKCSIKYSYHTFSAFFSPLSYMFCFTAAFHCGGHTLVQKSRDGRTIEGWVGGGSRGTGSDVTKGPEGEGGERMEGEGDGMREGWGRGE